ncbi:hybrid sensor histidine kinase/response regulator [Rhodobacteraceae bacterium DSL-40]|uniref:response regulator n=1 Tax=Amaricoccus sp. B4 TaxID=3368557 RepID=UPI000DAF0A67
MTALETGFSRKNFRQDSLLSCDADTAMLTHDIRTALNGVVGGMALIDVVSLPAEAAMQVERARAASRVLVSLIEQVIGHDESVDDFDPLHDYVDLHEYRNFLVNRWEGEARARGASLEVVVGNDVPAALDCAMIDLSRMIGNLISNALRHAEAGEVKVQMSRSAQGGLDFFVRDSGPGVSDAVLRTVSRPGFGARLQGDEKHGLGLQIVKALASELGGRFSLRNRPEGGAIAAIWLPERLCIRSVATEVTRPSIEPAANFPALAGSRVLLAEDNPTNQMVASQMLEALKARVKVCSDGVEALEAFAEDEYDLVIVDIEMPRLSGLDVIRAIRALPDERSRTPIVALTAYALREHRDRIAEAGANGLISKPITGIKDLGRSLSAHLTSAVAAQGQEEVMAVKVPEPASIDRDVYDALVGAIGGEMMEELLEKVLADLANARDDLQAALTPLNIQPIRAASHILISVGGAVGANRLLASARSVNAAAHESDTSGLPDLVRRCIAELDRAIMFVSDELQKARG